MWTNPICRRKRRKGEVCEKLVSCQLSVVSGPLSVVRCQLSVVRCQWSVVSGPLSVVRGPLSVVRCQWSVVSCPLSVVVFGIGPLMSRSDLMNLARPFKAGAYGSPGLRRVATSET